jgi:hypothetical protein
MGRSHPGGLIIAPGKANKPLASRPALDEPGRVAIELYYPGKIWIWSFSGPPRLAFAGLIALTQSADSAGGRAVSSGVVSP